MAEIEIEYCVACGLRPRALEVGDALLDAFETRVDGLRLKTGRGGVFKVRVDDELVYDKAEEGFDLDSLKERVAESVQGPGGDGS